MQGPDLEVFKDIPGYKAILKAVLKSQIQALVEQLATQTGEESVLLTASVEEGTLSHLGSDFGKVFLDGHDDIKSQFLGFCLKRHQLRVSSNNMTKAQMRKRGPKGPIKRPRLNYPNAQPQTTTYHQTTDATEDSSYYDSSTYAASFNQPEMTETFPSPNIHPTSVYGTENNRNEMQQNSESFVKQEPNDTEITQQFGQQEYTDGSQMVSNDMIAGQSYKQGVDGSDMAAGSQGDEVGRYSDKAKGQGHGAKGQGYSASNQNQTNENGKKDEKEHGDASVGMETEEVTADQKVTPGKSTRNLSRKSYAETEVKFEDLDESVSLERPYPCNVCPKRFKERHHLTYHLRTHSGQRPYVCEICNKAFTQTSSLNTHKRTHMNEVCCGMCGRVFKKKSDFSLHVCYNPDLDTVTLNQAPEVEGASEYFNQTAGANTGSTL